MHRLIRLQQLFDQSRHADFLAPLLLRLYLAPVFWESGINKLNSMEATIAWFGNAEWGLGLPFPTLLAWLATLTELGGAVLLVVGLAVRWVSIPLLVTMAVAALSVHWHNGWLAIADSSMESAQRLKGFLAWLGENFPARHEFITELGKPVMLNNGIEFAATYFVMLLALLFIGAGRWLSLDYWIRGRWMASA